VAISVSGLFIQKKRKKRQPIDGVVVLDKPTGVTSNTALQTVKRILWAEKAGHAGTLDPLATGVLPILLGEAAKFSQYVLESNKTYLAHGKLGAETDTGDAEGAIISSCEVPPLTSELIQSHIQRFLGPISQVPPMFSAIKKDGKPLYALAREGVAIEREPRLVTIYSADLQSYCPDTVTFSAVFTVSKGTYLRTLVEDIGKSIGCGAHLVALRRMSAGPFHLSQSVTLADLNTYSERETSLSTAEEALQEGISQSVSNASWLQPVDVLFQELQRVNVDEMVASRLRLGQAVRIEAPSEEGEVVSMPIVLFCRTQFLGVGEWIDGVIRPRRLIAVEKPLLV
jgi:tRNA pseudouridine55 synthase